MEKESVQKTDICLNCGSHKVENYCANCGQKAQATQQPLRIFISDAAETLFNIDNRWLKTIRHLFIKPGKATREYLEGKRARYLPPLKVYVSISVVYFLFAQFIDGDNILFIDFTQDSGDGTDINLAKVVQTSLIFLVPVLAWFMKLLHRKRKAFYVEYLIFSVHLHSVWFVLFSVQLLMIALSAAIESHIPGWLNTVIDLTGELYQLFAMVYLVIYVKKVFKESWLKAIFKSAAGLILYLLSLALATFLAIWIL